MKYVPSWFPGAQFKRNAKMWKKTTDRMFDDPFNRIKDEMVNPSPAWPALVLQY